MAKLRVQAQHLQPGDIVGSGEKVRYVANAGISIPKGKCEVALEKPFGSVRSVLWGKYTMIGVERNEPYIGSEQHEQDCIDACYSNGEQEG